MRRLFCTTVEFLVNKLPFALLLVLFPGCVLEVLPASSRGEAGADGEYKKRPHCLSYSPKPPIGSPRTVHLLRCRPLVSVKVTSASFCDHKSKPMRVRNVILMGAVCSF